MNATYTRNQAMKRLGIKSANAFKHLAKKFPASFVLVEQGLSKFSRYDKDALDSFAERQGSPKNQFHFA